MPAKPSTQQFVLLPARGMRARPMDGTSVACPAATGGAARLLAAEQNILQTPRDAARSDSMAKYILQHTKLLGFGHDYEGQGLLVIP